MPKAVSRARLSFGGAATRRSAGCRPTTAASEPLWRPHPEHCPGGPVNLLHTHGTADTVVPMAGRPIRTTFHQGDVREGMALWRDQDACGGAPVRAASAGDLDCEAWTGCGSGRALELCLHPGGHKIPQGWAGMAFEWAEAVSSRLVADSPR